MAATEAEVIPPESLQSTIVRKVAYADYDARFKAAALELLKANRGKLKTTAKLLKIPPSTLKDWRDGKFVSSQTHEIREAVKGDIAEEFEQTARLYMGRAQDPAAIAQTSGYYAVMAASKSMETAQLMRGLPTSISGSVMSEDERRLRLAELLAKIEARAKADPD